MNELLSKQGKSITDLARILLNAAPGERLPAMQQIATEQDVSVGTVQAAMQYLQTEQVVEIENRGRLGGFVQQLDYLRLWSLAYRRTMTAMLPMPYSRRLEGLAASLRETFDASSFDLALRFMRGSTARIQRLHAQQCDWVVTSRYAAEASWARGFDVEIVFALGAGTYTIGHVLVLNGSSTLQGGMRIGIDTHSADHAYMVRQLSRGVPVNFVEIDYSAGLDLLLSGEIDVVIWTERDLPVLPDHIHVQPIAGDLFDSDQIERLGEAVIISLPGVVAVKHILQNTLDAGRLREIQREVLEGRRRPTY